jgi:hypothetical protein
MGKRSPKNIALGAREYSKFRETVDGEYAVAVSNEDYAVFVSVAATSKDETTVIAAPGAGKALKIKYLMINNADTDANAVSFQAGVSGSEVFKVYVPQYGGTWNANLVNNAWLLPENTALVVNLGAAGSVYATAGYEVIDISSTRMALSDSQAIEESQVGELTEGE